MCSQSCRAVEQQRQYHTAWQGGQTQFTQSVLLDRNEQKVIVLAEIQTNCHLQKWHCPIMLFMEEADAARRRKREKPESDSESDIICKVLEGVRLVNYEFAIKKEKSQKSKIKRKHKKSKDKRKKKTRLRDTSSPQNVVKGFSESMNQSRRSKVCQDLICQKNICSKQSHYCRTQPEPQAEKPKEVEMKPVRMSRQMQTKNEANRNNLNQGVTTVRGSKNAREQSERLEKIQQHFLRNRKINQRTTKPKNKKQEEQADRTAITQMSKGPRSGRGKITSSLKIEESPQSSKRVIKRRRPMSLVSPSSGSLDFPSKREIRRRMLLNRPHKLKRAPIPNFEQLDSNEDQGGGENRYTKFQLSVTQSTKLINLFAINAGDFVLLNSQLSSRKERIRPHLRMLFNRNLDIISEVAEKECGFNLKSWNKYERREVIRELFRIRATNRLLSEINREFRENFLQLMSSYNERDMQMESQDIGLLYRKIQAFVRGFITKNSSNEGLSDDAKPCPENESKLIDLNRYPFNDYCAAKDEASLKLEAKQQESPRRVSGEKSIDQIAQCWNKAQEEQLVRLYVEFVQENGFQKKLQEQLISRFGEGQRWLVVDVLQRKIELMIYAGIARLYDRATGRPLSLQQEPFPVYDTSEQQFLRSDSRQIAVFADYMKLVKLVTDKHDSSKIRIRKALVKLLSNPQTSEEEIKTVLDITKDYMKFAEFEQRKSRLRQLVRPGEQKAEEKDEEDLDQSDDSEGKNEENEGRENGEDNQHQTKNETGVAASS